MSKESFRIINVNNLQREYITLGDIKISIKPLNTRKARERLIEFLQFYDNGDSGGKKGDTNLQKGELENLRKDLKRNGYTNKAGELEITEGTIEKFTYAIEKEHQPPGISVKCFAPIMRVPHGEMITHRYRVKLKKK